MILLSVVMMLQEFHWLKQILNRKPSKPLPVRVFTLQWMNWNGIGKRASVTPVNLFSSGEPAVVRDTEEASTDRRPCTPQLSTSRPSTPQPSQEAPEALGSPPQKEKENRREKNEVLEFLMEDCGLKKKKKKGSRATRTQQDWPAEFWEKCRRNRQFISRKKGRPWCCSNIYLLIYLIYLLINFVVVRFNLKISTRNVQLRFFNILISKFHLFYIHYILMNVEWHVPILTNDLTLNKLINILTLVTQNDCVL